MEENETIDPEYLKGFNEGYLIAKELPELAEQLKSIEGNSPRLQGYKDGREQNLSERNKELLPDWLSKQPNLPSIERMKNKDDIDLDKE